MSFDVFVQAFEAGDGAAADAALLAELIAPKVVERSGASARLRFGDGELDLYGIDDLAHGFMVNHVEGREAWSFLADIASRAGLAILPADLPTAVFDRRVLSELPPELAEDAVLLADGADLVSLILGP